MRRQLSQIPPIITLKGSLYGNELESGNIFLRVVGNEGYPQLQIGYFVLKQVDAVYWRIIFAIFPKN
jgi:hypothetical protein